MRKHIYKGLVSAFIVACCIVALYYPIVLVEYFGSPWFFSVYIFTPVILGAMAYFADRYDPDKKEEPIKGDVPPAAKVPTHVDIDTKKMEESLPHLFRESEIQDLVGKPVWLEIGGRFKGWDIVTDYHLNLHFGKLYVTTARAYELPLAECNKSWSMFSFSPQQGDILNGKILY